MLGTLVLVLLWTASDCEVQELCSLEFGSRADPDLDVGPGRRSRDLSLSAASSRDGTYARPPISKVRSLIYGKPKRTVPSQDLGQELDTFHSAKSAQFFSVETGAREGDAGTIDSQDR